MASFSNKAYAAGIVDGEGCLTVSRQKQGRRGFCYHAYLSVSNTKPRLMQFFSHTFGGRFHKKKRTNRKFRPLYVWFPKGKKETVKFILAIMPFLVVKRVQARWLLDFLELKGQCPGLRYLHYKQLQYLNKRGM